MEEYKKQFTDFMLSCNALKFGDFTLKSGRRSPFFMNAGAYVEGGQLHDIACYYAKAINDNFGLDFDVLFGPAYKGIPLAVATAMAIHELYGKEVRYCSNRKDGDRVIMIEDVTTSGKSMEETVPIVKAQANVEIKGLIVSLNRNEKGKGNKTALAEISDLYGFKTAAIVSMPEVVEILKEKNALSEELLERIDAYYAEYGATE